MILKSSNFPLPPVNLDPTDRTAWKQHDLEVLPIKETIDQY